MKKSSPYWQSLSRQIKNDIEDSGLTMLELARASGADYFSIRRILKQPILKNSRNLEKLCVYLQIDLTKLANESEILRQSLLRTIDSIWNGSPEHARLLVRLIESTEGFIIGSESELKHVKNNNTVR